MSFRWLGARPEHQRRPEDQAVYGLRIKRPQLDDGVPRHQQRAHREHHVARQTHPLPEQRRIVEVAARKGNFPTTTRAREIQGEYHADMAVHSALEARDAGLGRLAYDALKWHASKLVPKVYGDKTEVAVTGPNGGPMQTVNATVEIPANDPIEASRVYQKLMQGD